MSNDTRRAAFVTISIVLVLWTAFWVCYFMTSDSVSTTRSYEQVGPVFKVFHQGLAKDAISVRAYPWLEGTIILNLPSWLLTWPITRIRLEEDFLGTNLYGVRLILTNALSFAQWMGIVLCFRRLRERRRIDSVKTRN